MSVLVCIIEMAMLIIAIKHRRTVIKLAEILSYPYATCPYVNGRKKERRFEFSSSEPKFPPLDRAALVKYGIVQLRGYCNR